ncbi:MAG: T9SS type A sorting domain-containing protein [Candidatus Kapaibacterium sp.]
MKLRTLLLAGLFSLSSLSLSAQSSDIEWITWNNEVIHTDLAISPDNKYIATTALAENIYNGSRQDIRIYSTEQGELDRGGELLKIIPNAQVIKLYPTYSSTYFALAFSPNNSLLISQNFYDTVEKDYASLFTSINLEVVQEQEFIRNPESNALLYSSGIYAYFEKSSSLELSTIHIRDLSQNLDVIVNNRYSSQEVGGAGINLVALSGDGSALAIRQMNHYWIVETSTGEVIGEQQYFSQWKHVAFAPDNHSLIFLGYDNAIKILNFKTGELDRRIVSGDLYNYQYQRSAMALSHDGRYIAATSLNGTIHLWNLRTAEQVHIYDDYHGVFTDIEFSPDGNHLIGITYDGALLSYKGPDQVASIEDQEQLQANRLELVNSSTFNAHSHTARFTFTLPERSDVQVGIYNLQGKLVGELTEPTLEEGEHSVEWQRSDLASGVYFYRLSAGNQVGTGRLIVQ